MKTWALTEACQEHLAVSMKSLVIYVAARVLACFKTKNKGETCK